MGSTMDEVRRIRLQVWDELSRMTPETARRTLKENVDAMQRRMKEIHAKRALLEGTHETT